MKLIDRNGRLFGKISVVDVLVILVVAVMALALYVKGHQTQTSTSTVNSTITYQVQVRGIRTYLAQAVKEGDYLYDQDRSSGGSLGEILSIEEEPGSSLATLDSGTMEVVPMEDSVNLLLTVKGSGIISDGRYLLNRVYDLGVNSARNFYTPYAQFTGTVVKIL